MKRWYVYIVVTAAVVAADPVGRVTSWGPVTLSGSSVPATAVASLPVVAGDEITTATSAAVIVFRDRSRATIEPNSRVKLEADGASVRLRVLSGSAELKRVEGSQVNVVESILPSAPNSALSPVSVRAESSTSLARTSSLSKAAKTGAAVAAARSKRCPEPPNDDDRDRNCGKGNDGKLP